MKTEYLYIFTKYAITLQFEAISKLITMLHCIHKLRSNITNMYVVVYKSGRCINYECS